MSDDRSERLRQRRKRSTAQPGNRGSTDAESAHNSSKPDERSEPTSSSETGTESSVKEEQIGTYMYLPESQTKELRRQYNMLKAEYEFEYDEEFQKNRHFYPLVVQYGLESLEDMSASEIRESLQQIM